MTDSVDDSSLLSKFVYISKYFNPRDNMDPKAPHSIKTVNAEKIFAKLIGEFNPFGIHQDCHEFLVLLLDRLHDEMALLKGEDKPEEIEEGDSKKESSTSGTDWNEVGAGNQ